MSLIEALVETRHLLASDLRDKMYALLNITYDGPETVPTPNYKLPVDEVYFRALKEALLMNREFGRLARSHPPQRSKHFQIGSILSKEFPP